MKTKPRPIPVMKQSIRKPYNNKAGYIASRHNLVNNGWVVIYEAKKQQIDSDYKYIVVCELHAVMVSVPSIPKARPLLKYPDFCEECTKTNQL